jgi:hypothetical protein
MLLGRKKMGLFDFKGRLCWIQKRLLKYCFQGQLETKIIKAEQILLRNLPLLTAPCGRETERPYPCKT